MGIFQSREEKVVKMFEKAYKERLGVIWGLATDQGAPRSERTLWRCHNSAVRDALGRLSQRGYLGLNEKQFVEIYWPVAQSQYHGKLTD